MDNDPYHVFELSPGASEEEIRKRYLELVRRHPPERDPERFAEIRAAYDALRDPITRLRSRLFETDKSGSLRDIAEEAQRRVRSARIPAKALLSIAQSS